MTALEYLFWFSAVLAVYPYTIFPLTLVLMRLVAAGHPSRHAVKETKPLQSSAFSMLVPAYNEGAHIVGKIEQTLPALALDPANEMIIVSDHSTDDTVAVAKSVAHPQVRVLENAGGRGKAGATNYAVPFARNELLVQSDVGTRVPAETVAQVVDMLRQPGVGCVNAETVFVNATGDTVAEAAGLYWKFEMWLRSIETTLNLYATSSGSCMAVRRSLFKDLPPAGDTDFTTPLDVVDAGYRCVHMSGCLAYDVMTPDAGAEFKTRVRMVAKNFAGTILRWRWRNIFRRPLHTWALYSHKVLRWLTPFFLLAAFVSNALLLEHGLLYEVIFPLQVAFYAAALLGWLGYRLGRKWPILLPVYAFVLANIAFFLGVLKSLAGGGPAFFVPTHQLQK
jgi:cellulose synthase/poly-beta-1,6-N-acetylglucosamine synthase-like glycosyltransferase